MRRTGISKNKISQSLSSWSRCAVMSPAAVVVVVVVGVLNKVDRVGTCVGILVHLEVAG